MNILDCKISTLSRIIGLLRDKKPRTVMNIAQNTKITYFYVLEIIKEMERIGLVTAEKVGRKKNVTATPKLLKVRLFEVEDAKDIN